MGRARNNPQCADALMASLSSLYGDKKLIFLTGVLRDKDWQQMLRRALPLAKAFGRHHAAVCARTR